jgi:hypothetical protein
VLPGVHEQLLVLLAHEIRDRGGLHELGSVADYGDQSHRVTEGIMPTGIDKKLFDVAAGAFRHLAWYLGYRTGATGPRDL